MRRALALLLAACAGCTIVPEKTVRDAVSPQPAQPWTPPSAKAAMPPPPVEKAAPVVPEEYLKPGTTLSLAQLVDVGLHANPQTRAAWASARSAAANVGAKRAPYFPTFEADGQLLREKTPFANGPGLLSILDTTYGPTVAATWLLFDSGGREADVEQATRALYAANWTHNAAIQDVVLQIASAYYQYLNAKALVIARQANLDEARRSLDSAQERHRAGVATIADVLQARTARSQAELQLQTLEGILLVTKGSLAVSMGLAANTPFDVPAVTLSDSVHFITESVDSLIDVAVRNRPELASARAQAAAANSQIRVAKSGYLPSLAFVGTGANNASNVSNFAGNTYSLNLGLSVPVFSGFSNHYDVAAANEQYQAAQARTELTRQQIIQQVFTAYYTLRTATDRVRTSRDLLASAIQSEEVARGRYREGVGSIVDLLVAQSALATARSQDVDSRWQWRSALAQLAHDVGVLNARGDATFPQFTPAPNVRPQQ